MKRALLFIVPAVLLLAGCAAPATSTTAAACDDAMKVTSEVPFDQSNAVEFQRTLTECGSFAEWKSTLQKYPAVGAVPEITDAEVPLYLQIACGQLPDQGASNAICQEGL